jgi:hypothetical protein
MSWLPVLIGCFGSGAWCSFVVYIVMRQRECRAERAHEVTLARESRLESPPTGLPSWIVVGWNGEGKHLVLSSVNVTGVDFRQEGGIRPPQRMAGFRHPVRLTWRRCLLHAEFPAYTVLNGVTTFEQAVAGLRLSQPALFSGPHPLDDDH